MTTIPKSPCICSMVHCSVDDASPVFFSHECHPTEKIKTFEKKISQDKPYNDYIRRIFQCFKTITKLEKEQQEIRPNKSIKPLRARRSLPFVH